MKVQIQDDAPGKKEDMKPMKEQEKPHVPVEETPTKSIKEVELKAKTPKKEEENHSWRGRLKKNHQHQRRWLRKSLNGRKKRKKRRSK